MLKYDVYMFYMLINIYIYMLNRYGIRYMMVDMMWLDIYIYIGIYMLIEMMIDIYGEILILS